MNATREKQKVPVDFKKKWMNGHKFFTAAEARGLGEIQRTENLASINFELNKDKMIKARNPMAGDSTPRNENGEPVLNPRAFEQVKKGVKLFPSERPVMRELKKKPEPVAKIGIEDSKYDVLGNKIFRASAAQPEDLYKLSQMNATLKANRQREAETLKACKEKAHALRQMKQLEVEVELLRAAGEARERELSRLRSTYS